MNSSNKKRAELLGMPFGTATGRLRKSLLFKAAQALGWDICYRCKNPILEIEDFSIEHKQSWLYAENPREKFFDLDNIAFSHLICNMRASLKVGAEGNSWNKGRVSSKRKVGPEGTAWCRMHKAFIPINEFGKDSIRWTGLKAECLSCRAAWRKQRYTEGKSR